MNKGSLQWFNLNPIFQILKDMADDTYKKDSADLQVGLTSMKCIARAYDIASNRDKAISDFVINEHLSFFLADGLLVGCPLYDHSPDAKFLLLENVLSFDAGPEYLIALDSTGMMLVCKLTDMQDGFFQITLEPQDRPEELLIPRAGEDRSPRVQLKLFESEGIVVLATGNTASVFQLLFGNEDKPYEGRRLIRAAISDNNIEIKSVALWTTPLDELVLVCTSSDGDLFMRNISVSYAAYRSQVEQAGETGDQICQTQLICHSTLSQVSEKRWTTAISSGIILVSGLVGVSGDSLGGITAWAMSDDNTNRTSIDSIDTASSIIMKERVVEMNLSKHLISAIQVVSANMTMWIGCTGGFVTEVYVDDDDELSLIAARRVSWRPSSSIFSIQWVYFDEYKCGRLRYLCHDEGIVVEATVPDAIEAALSLCYEATIERGPRNVVSACATITEADICVIGSVCGTFVEVWDVLECRAIVRLPLAQATAEYGGGIAGPCCCVAAHAVVTSGLDRNDGKKDIDCILVAIGQRHGHLSIYALIDSSKEICLESDSLSVDSIPVATDDACNHTIKEIPKDVKPTQKKLNGDEIEGTKAKQKSLLHRALGGEVILSKPSPSDIISSRTIRNEIKEKEMTKHGSSSKQHKVQALAPRGTRNSKGSIQHTSVLDIIEEASSHSRVSSSSGKHATGNGRQSKGNPKRKKAESTDSAARSISRIASNGTLLDSDNQRNDAEDVEDSISAVSSVESDGGSVGHSELFTGNARSRDKRSELVSVAESVRSGWKIRNRISVDQHCRLPVTDLFFSSLGGYVAVCYGRRTLVLHSLLISKAVFQMEISNALTDISSVKLTLREEGASVLHDHTHKSRDSLKQAVGDDNLILLLNVNSDLKLLDVMRRKFLPNVDLSYLGNSVPVVGTSFWCLQHVIPTKSYSGDFGGHQKDTISVHSFKDTSASFGTNNDFMVVNRYSGIFVSDTGSVFYVDPERELRRRLIENVIPDRMPDDPLNNCIAGVSSFMTYPDSPSLVLAVSWQHSVALKRLIVSSNSSTESDIAALSALHLRVNPSDLSRVIHVGHLRTGSRSRTSRMVIILSDGSCFIVRI